MIVPGAAFRPGQIRWDRRLPGRRKWLNLLAMWKPSQTLRLLSALSLLTVVPAWADGGGLYRDDDYPAAYEAYQSQLESDDRRHGDKLEYGAGTAAYKTEHYGAAAEHLGRAILTEDPDLRGKAYYNLGNTLFQLGKATEEPEAIRDRWKAAIAHYREAEALEGSVASKARHNREVVEKHLEALDEREQQRQQEEEHRRQREQEAQEEGAQDRETQEREAEQPEAEQPEAGEGETQRAEEGEAQERAQLQAGEGEESQEHAASQEGEDQGDDENLGNKKDAEGEVKSLGQHDEQAAEKAISAFESTPDGKLSEAAARLLLESLRNEEIKAPHKILRLRQGRNRVIRDW